MTAPLSDSSSPGPNTPDDAGEGNESPDIPESRGREAVGRAGATDRTAKTVAAKAATPTTFAKTARKTTGRPSAKARRPATPLASGETEATGIAASTAKRPTKAAASKSKSVTAADAKTLAAETKAASSKSKAASSSKTKTTVPKAGSTATKETAATKRPLVRAENVTDVAEVNALVVQEDGSVDAVPAPAAIAEGTAASADEGAAISVEEKAVAAETAEASHTLAEEEPEEDRETTDTPEAGAESEGPERDTAEVSADTVEPGSGRHALVIRGLVKTFGEHRAVDGVSLTVPAGSFYGIVGPNGAGKTTTLSIVAGLLSADEGAVHVCGVDQRKDPREAKRLMGVLPDRLRTFDRLTGRQLLHYYGLLRGLATDVVEKRTADLARAFDLTGVLGRVVSDYSAGMKKKIMLAGAMIHSPRVLVLDEPFESVGPVSSGMILDILGAYVTHGGTVILSSHGMDLVEKVCSRIAIIVGGEVLAEGTVEEVRAGQTLEQRFVELSGGAGEVEGLEWLHAFSD